MTSASTSTSTALLTASLTAHRTVAEALTRPPMLSGVAALTHGLAAGEEEAFREFHQQYFDRLYQFLLVVVRGEEQEAQEALQETLLRVIRYARVFESEEAFWCWLKVVARSAARDIGRKRRRYRALLQNFALRRREDERANTADGLATLRTFLEESLDGLAPDDRQLIQGKYLEGATVKDLSMQTGLSEKTVESRLLRLRRQLRGELLQKLRTP